MLCVRCVCLIAEAVRSLRWRASALTSPSCAACVLGVCGCAMCVGVSLRRRETVPARLLSSLPVPLRKSSAVGRSSPCEEESDDECEDADDECVPSESICVCAGVLCRESGAC